MAELKNGKNIRRDIRLIIETGAIVPGEWLLVITVSGPVLYVADGYAGDAGRLFPEARVYEIDNNTASLKPKCRPN